MQYRQGAAAIQLLVPNHRKVFNKFRETRKRLDELDFDDLECEEKAHTESLSILKITPAQEEGAITAFQEYMILSMATELNRIADNESRLYGLSHSKRPRIKVKIEELPPGHELSHLDGTVDTAGEDLLSTLEDHEGHCARLRPMSM